MGKYQYVPLAHVYVPKKHSVAGRFLSEKLDGQRAVWDGGVSRGILKSKVPYANCDRDGRFVTPEVATGLWSRYGNVIHAPDWFLDQMPKCLVDLELYAGRKQFQFVQSTVRDKVPGPGWGAMRAMILDAPPVESWLKPRSINERNIKLTITKKALQWWLETEGTHAIATPGDNATFEARLRFLRGRVKESEFIRIHEQKAIPFSTKDAEAFIADFTNQVLEGGGEGSIIKSRSGLYICERVYDTLKCKPWYDDEATVVGYYWGDVPDNTRSVSGEADGKYLGEMGSLYVQYGPHKFKLSGFTDEERHMSYVATGECAADEGTFKPALYVEDHIHNKVFPRGSTVTFKYRELSDDGIPKEARYLRKREEK